MRLGSEREPIHDLHLCIDRMWADSCGMRFGHTIANANYQYDDLAYFDRCSNRCPATPGSTAATACDPAHAEATGAMLGLPYADRRGQPRPPAGSCQKEPGRLPGVSRLGPRVGEGRDGDSAVR